MNAKKLLSTLLSAAMAVSMLYSDEAADAANAAQSTVVFATDTTLAKSLQDALADGLTQLDEIDDAMEADENLKPLLTSGWDLDIFAAQGEDAEAAAKTIAEQYIVSAVIGKKAEGKIAMVLHDGNGYYYVAVLTYGNGGSGSGGGTGGGSGSGDDDHPGGNPGGTDPDDPNKPGTGDDDDENSMYDVTVTWNGNGTVTINGEPCKSGESVSLRSGTKVTIVASDSEDYVFASWTVVPADAMQNGNECIISSLDSDLNIGVVYNEKAPETYTVTVTAGNNGTVTDEDGNAVTSINVTEGDSVTLKVAANDTFQIESLTVKGDNGSETISEATGNYDVYELKLENITENKVVDVSFEKCDVTGIAVKENPDQMTYEDGDTFDPEGMVITVTYEDGNTEDIEEGFTYETDPLTPDNNEVTITYEGAETTLSVTVNPKQYDVKVVTEGNNDDSNIGYVDTNNVTSVTAGNDFGFTVHLKDEYYKVESITVKRGNDDAVAIFPVDQFAENESYTVEDINSDVVITVTFAERDVIDIKVVPSEIKYKVGESIDKTDDLKVYAVYENNVQAAEPLDANEFTVSPESFDTAGEKTVTVTYGEFTKTYGVTVEANKYTVTVVSDNGTVDGAPTTVEDGKGFEFTVSPAGGYEVTGAKVTNGDANVSVDGNKITVSNVKSDIEVTVQFAKKRYDVTINIVNSSFGTVKDTINNKTLADGATITVEHGEDVELQITSKTGYRIAKVEGTTSGNSGNYKLENITGPATITVTFEKIPVVTGIEIVDGSFKDEYTCYDKLDLSNMQIKVAYDNGKTETITITNNSQVGIKHVDQTTGWWDDGVKNQYEGGQWVGGIILGYQKGGHWVAKFNITYKDFTDSIEVNVTCGDNSDRTYDCRYCPNWDGMSNIARSTRSAKAHFSTESKG